MLDPTTIRLHGLVCLGVLSGLFSCRRAGLLGVEMVYADSAKDFNITNVQPWAAKPGESVEVTGDLIIPDSRLSLEGQPINMQYKDANHGLMDTTAPANAPGTPIAVPSAAILIPPVATPTAAPAGP